VATAYYDIGDTIKLTGTFTVGGVLTAPTAVTMKVKNLSTGVTTTVTPTSPSTGVYTGNFDPVNAGEHWYRVAGTGTAKSAAEDTFVVREQRVP